MKQSFLLILAGLLPLYVMAASPERKLDDAATRRQIEVLKQLDRDSIQTKIMGRAAEYFAPGTEGSLHPSLPAELAFYPSAYGFDRLNGHARVEWGIIPSEGFKLFTVKISPTIPNGKLVVFAHGYLDHIGRSTNFYDELARSGYTVVTFDLPGHGLSSGASANITDFKIYARVLAEFVSRFQKEFEETIVVGFSTGGSAIVQARMYGLIDPSLRAVLVSPLLRIKFWQIAEPGFLAAFYLRYANNWSVLDLLIAPATQVTAVTNDGLFLESHRLDPLRPKNIPSFWTYSYVQYAQAAQKWSDGLSQEQKAVFGPTLIVQGRDDSVVDGTAGVDFVTKSFNGAQAVWIPKGGHHLLNEGVAYFRKPRQAIDLLPLVYAPVLQFIDAKN